MIGWVPPYQNTRPVPPPDSLRDDCPWWFCGACLGTERSDAAKSQRNGKEPSQTSSTYYNYGYYSIAANTPTASSTAAAAAAAAAVAAVPPPPPPPAPAPATATATATATTTIPPPLPLLLRPLLLLPRLLPPLLLLMLMEKVPTVCAETVSKGFALDSYRGSLCDTPVCVCVCVIYQKGVRPRA